LVACNELIGILSFIYEKLCMCCCRVTLWLNLHSENYFWYLPYTVRRLDQSSPSFLPMHLGNWPNNC
jgi:hypothetical protein